MFRSIIIFFFLINNFFYTKENIKEEFLVKQSLITKNKLLYKFLNSIRIDKYTTNCYMGFSYNKEYLFIYNGIDKISIFDGKNNFHTPIKISKDFHILDMIANDKYLIISFNNIGNITFIINIKRKKIVKIISNKMPFFKIVFLNYSSFLAIDIFANIYCYNFFGNELWKQNFDYSKIQHDIKNPILIYEDKIFLSLNNNSLTVLNKENGAIINNIQFKLGHHEILDIKEYNDAIYVLTNNGLFIIDNTLRIINELKTINPISNMIIQKDKIYFHDNKFLFIIPINNLLEYKIFQLKKKSLIFSFSNLILFKNFILIPGGNGSLIIYDTELEKIGVIPTSIRKISQLPPIIWNNHIIYHNNFVYGKNFTPYYIETIKKKLKK